MELEKPRSVTNIELERIGEEVVLKLTATTMWPDTVIEKSQCSRYVSDVGSLQDAGDLVDKIIDWENHTGKTFVMGSPQFLNSKDIKELVG